MRDLHALRRAAAALLVVGLSSTLLACTDSSPDDDPRSAATPPTETSATPPTPAVDPWAGLHRGTPARWGYTVAGVHVAPDGTRTRLPRRHGISAVTPSDHGLVVAEANFFEGTNGLLLVAGDRTSTLAPGPVCTSGPGLVSPDGARIAWVSFGCPESGVPAPTELHVLAPDGPLVTRLPQPPDTPVLSAAVAFRGDRVVVGRVFGEEALLVDPTGATPPRPIVPPPVRNGHLRAAALGLPVGLRTLDVVREPSGDRLVVATHRGASALLRVRRSGRVELLAPARRPVRGTLLSPVYLLDEQLLLRG